MEYRIRRAEKKLNPKPESYTFVDWGNGEGEKKAKQILKDDPNADVLLIKVTWV